MNSRTNSALFHTTDGHAYGPDPSYDIEELLHNQFEISRDDYVNGSESSSSFDSMQENSDSLNYDQHFPSYHVASVFQIPEVRVEGNAGEEMLESEQDGAHFNDNCHENDDDEDFKFGIASPSPAPSVEMELQHEESVGNNATRFNDESDRSLSVGSARNGLSLPSPQTKLSYNLNPPLIGGLKPQFSISDLILNTEELASLGTELSPVKSPMKPESLPELTYHEFDSLPGIDPLPLTAKQVDVLKRRKMSLEVQTFSMPKSSAPMIVPTSIISPDSEHSPEELSGFFFSAALARSHQNRSNLPVVSKLTPPTGLCVITTGGLVLSPSANSSYQQAIVSTPTSSTSSSYSLTATSPNKRKYSSGIEASSEITPTTASALTTLQTLTLGKKGHAPLSSNSSRPHPHHSYNTHNSYPCPLPGCGQTFHKQMNLLSHIKTHNSPRIFSCSVCAATFRRSHDLRRHISSLHNDGGRAFECLVCPKRFARLDALKRHVGRVGNSCFVDLGEEGVMKRLGELVEQIKSRRSEGKAAVVADFVASLSVEDGIDEDEKKAMQEKKKLQKKFEKGLVRKNYQTGGASASKNEDFVPRQFKYEELAAADIDVVGASRNSSKQTATDTEVSAFEQQF